MLGHAVVVHAPTNEKIACGLLVVKGAPRRPPQVEEDDDLSSSVVGAMTIFGLACGLCCLCRLYESCKKTYRKRQGRDTTGFSQLPVVRTGAVDSDEVELGVRGGPRGGGRPRSLEELEDSSDGFLDVSDSDSDVQL